MSKVWPHVTRQTPCPICGKPDWCLIGHTRVICMRVESPYQVRSGGWYHSKTGEHPAFLPPRKDAPPPPKPYFQTLMTKWIARTTRTQVVGLSTSLGVSLESLEVQNAAWAPDYKAWAFPMRNERNEIVGIRLRSMGGAKWAVTTSRQGLFIPQQSFKLDGPLYICEGPTSLAALLTLGFPAIGRASCQAGADMIKAYLELNHIYRVIIVADNDRKERQDGSLWNPGMEGAERLVKELRVKSLIWEPPYPYKDVRDYLRKGATKGVIESQWKDKKWTTK